MTCHARVCLAAAICLLPVAVIELCLDTLLVAAIGTAPLVESGLAATNGIAVALAAITVPANPELRVASAAAADALVENRFVNRHVRPHAGLDNGCESWQVRTSLNVVTCSQVAQPEPHRLRRRGSIPPSMKTVHLRPALGRQSMRNRPIGTDANLL